MKIIAFVLSCCALILLLAGCGAPTETKPADAPAKPKVDAPVPVPVAPKGLGISHHQLILGTGNLVTLEQLEGRTKDGNQYKADIFDKTEKKGGVIVYGTPEVVTRVYFTASLPYADFPDESKYPEFMKNNLKVQDMMLGNLFGGKIPAEVTDALKWARENSGKEKTVTVDGKAVTVKYDVDKSITVDVK